MPKRGLYLIALIALVSAPFIVKTYLRAQTEADLLGAGDVISSFAVTSLDGGEKTVFPGKAVPPSVIVFFEVECPFCQTELGNLSQLQQALPETSVIGISGSTEARTKAYLAKTPLSFPVYLDDSGQARRSLAIKRVPAVFIVDEHAQVLHYRTGIVPPDRSLALYRTLALNRSPDAGKAVAPVLNP